jgi:hypothetical protein
MGGRVQGLCHLYWALVSRGWLGQWRCVPQVLGEWPGCRLHVRLPARSCLAAAMRRGRRGRTCRNSGVIFTRVIDCRPKTRCNQCARDLDERLNSASVPRTWTREGNALSDVAGSRDGTRCCRRRLLPGRETGLRNSVDVRGVLCIRAVSASRQVRETREEGGRESATKTNASVVRSRRRMRDAGAGPSSPRRGGRTPLYAGQFRVSGDSRIRRREHAWIRKSCQHAARVTDANMLQSLEQPRSRTRFSTTQHLPTRRTTREADGRCLADSHAARVLSSSRRFSIFGALSAKLSRSLALPTRHWATMTQNCQIVDDMRPSEY